MGSNPIRATGAAVVGLWCFRSEEQRLEEMRPDAEKGLRLAEYPWTHVDIAIATDHPACRAGSRLHEVTDRLYS